MSSKNLPSFDSPLDPDEIQPSEIFNFNTFPDILQERFFELSTTSQIMKLRQLSSHCSTLAKKFHGKHPVDKLEIRELQPGGPIHFNQFRYVPSKKSVEYIANPLWKSYDPEFLQKLNIKKELAFTNVSLAVIDETIGYIDHSNVTSLEIRCNISWKNLKKLVTNKIVNFLFDGEIIGDEWSFLDFLVLIQNVDCVYANIFMDFPLVDNDEIFFEWFKNNQRPKKFHIFAHSLLPHSIKIYNSDSLQ